MANPLPLLISFLLVVSCAYAVAKPSHLKVGFYHKTCPSVETIVRNEVKSALAADPGLPAALIRLHFHDCFVRGCDGSVLLDSSPKNVAEKDSSANLGIAGFNVIDAAKAKIEADCPGVVSCADIVAFAARDGVHTAAGVYYSVPSGRRDGRVSRAADAPKNLPMSTFNVEQLKENFARKGLSLEEMVTLSGAHSIGSSHCSAFKKRLYSFSSAHHHQDPSLNRTYAAFLKTKCPESDSTNPTVSLDPVTPNTLDNIYYKNLKVGKGLLSSDEALWTTKVTRSMVKSNANHPKAWSKRFAAAMRHMGSIEVLTGHEGEIRKHCRMMN